MKEAFTLLEITIVMLITCMIFLLSFGLGQKFVQEQQEKIFWNNFKQEWNYAVIVTHRRDTNCTIQFMDSIIRFRYVDRVENGTPVMNGRKRDLKIPKTLKLISYMGTAKVTSEGGLSMNGCAYYSDIKHVKYVITPQVGYGGKLKIEVSKE